MSDAKKVLYISYTLPNDNIATAGGKAHNFYLKSIAADPRFHVVEVAFVGNRKRIEDCDLDKYDIEYHYTTRLKGKVGRLDIIFMEWNPFNKYGNMMSYYHVRAIMKLLKELWGKGFIPDIVITEWFQMTSMVSDIKKIFPDAKYVAVERDVAFLGAKRKADSSKGVKGLHLRRVYNRLRKKEIECLMNCDIAGVNNYKDLKLIIDEGVPEYMTHIVCPYYTKMEIRDYNYDSNNIVFYGAMNRMENYESAIWFIEHVMNKIPERYKFIVVGANPPVKLLNYKNNRIIVTGYVEDVSKYFEDCYCMVCPLLYGAGIKIKVIEAMSLGIPVLSNSIGIEGIPAKDGVEYIHCETANDYVCAINNRASVHEIAGNGREFVKNHFDYDENLQKYLDRIYNL